jgi:hypothetical protein
MLKKSLIAACCLTLVFCGCGKDEEERTPPRNEPVEPTVSVPRGMKPLSVEPPVFMSVRPLTRAQYIEYLTAMNKTVPAHHAGAPASEAITGLTPEQAARVATFHLRRLPTREEWQKADEIVGDTPWPWPEEGVPSTEPIYLVQDWVSDTAGEQEALEARMALKAGAGLEALKEELAAERKLLEEEMERFRAEHQQLWAQVKPAIFAMLDARRDLAAAEARVDARESYKDTLLRLALMKGKAAVKMIDSDASAAEQTAALNSYEEALAESRKKTAETIENLAQASGDLQEQAQALTAALEEYGKTAAASLPRAEAVLEATEEPGPTAADVQRQLGNVQDTITALKAREVQLPGLPSVEELQEKTRELREQVDAVEVPAQLQEEIDKVREMLAKHGKQIEQPFEQEPLLMQEQQKLMEARATHAGLAARVQALRDVLAKTEQAETIEEETTEPVEEAEEAE